MKGKPVKNWKLHWSCGIPPWTDFSAAHYSHGFQY